MLKYSVNSVFTSFEVLKLPFSNFSRIAGSKLIVTVGVFLFAGTTGLGKTELAKQLAKELFGSKENIIQKTIAILIIISGLVLLAISISSQK